VVGGGRKREEPLVVGEEWDVRHGEPGDGRREIRSAVELEQAGIQRPTQDESGARTREAEGCLGRDSSQAGSGS